MTAIKVEYKHITVKDKKTNINTIKGELFEFGARTCRVRLETPYGNYKVGTIVGVKTDKIKFL